MKNDFIPTLSRQPLYCVWIETGNPAHPLECVWIDPELRSFANMEMDAPNDENRPEAPAQPVTVNNTSNGTKQTTTTNDQGQSSFPSVPIGRYELEVNSSGFRPFKKSRSGD
jgi:Carboxypeptidase regulatory-like domain